jgi:hypothetical protein
MGVGVLLALCWLVLLAACAPAADLEREEARIGGETPEAVVVAFVENLNQALEDPQLSEEEPQRAWAERLASYFAPSERVDQRNALWDMLAIFAIQRDQMTENQELTLEVLYEDVQVTPEGDQGNRASVRLIGGTMHYRRVFVAENGYRSVISDRRLSFNEVLGMDEDAGLPVLQVNERWFLTER